MTEKHIYTRTPLGKGELTDEIRGEEQKFIDHMVELALTRDRSIEHVSRSSRNTCQRVIENVQSADIAVIRDKYLSDEQLGDYISLDRLDEYRAAVVTVIQSRFSGNES